MTTKKTFVLILLTALLLSLVPAAAFGEPGLNVYSSVIEPPAGSVPAQSAPANRNGNGAEFIVTLIDNGEGFPDNLYVASSRPSLDYFYYSFGASGDWTLIGGAESYQIIRIHTMSSAYPGSDRARELRLKVVSVEGGISRIAFGIDAVCAVDSASGRSLTHDESHIVQQASYPVTFTSSSTGGASGLTSTNINPYYSVVDSPDRPAPAQLLPLNANSEGLEFTLTVTGNNAITTSDKIYVASSRPDTDYLFYKVGTGSWTPYYAGGVTPLSSYATLTPFTHSSSLSGTVHEFKIKIVSTATGTSQIVFGVNAGDVADYAGGKALGNDRIGNIIGLRKFAAEFSAAASFANSNNINTYTSTVVGPARSAEAQIKPLRATGDGAEFTVTVAGYATINANDRIFVASSRPNEDYLYYRIGTGDWQPYNSVSDTPLSSVAALTPFTHSSSLSNTVHEFRLKIVSTSPGTSQVVFGTNAQDVYDYALGKAISDGLVNIFHQRRFSADYTEPSTIVTGNAISGFRGELISAGVKLRWDALSGGAGYRIYRSTSPTDEGTPLVDYTITSNEFVDVNVRPYTTYYYAVQQIVREAPPPTAAGWREEVGPLTAKIAITTPATILGDNLSPTTTGATRKYIMMTLDGSFMDVNGVRKEIDPGRGTTPMLINSRTMVPIRAIVEEMGGSAGWQDATREISVQLRANYVLMWLDQFNISVNGQTKTMDVAPASINGRTMVPLRFAAENLGCEVEWAASTRQIVIIYY